MAKQEVRVKGKVCRPHKSAVSPTLDSRTVLTESHWQFVELWLTRERQTDALLYWRQAREFHAAAKGLSAQASPLPLYYCYLNAAKCLLTSKGIAYDQHHGLREKRRAANVRIDLSNEGVKLLNRGVATALSAYFGEIESRTEHYLKDIFLNLPFIHRTYILSYPNETEVFIPLVDCRFIQDSVTRQAYFAASISKDFKSGIIFKRAPPSLIQDADGLPNGVRSSASLPCTHAGRPTQQDIANIVTLNKQLRGDIEYINGSQTLWYMRTRPSAANLILRRVPTLILMAMHRLSELSRYKPLELNKHLSSKKNWLIDEFLRMSPSQFIDEISSEITGFQFQVPNVRAPA
ncbi:YaaC family protein [Brucella anthropi]|uniref:YaaC family protein n=1 Tax=Brucella anthropi TaxID=529 RepID=UPI003D95459A